MGCNDNNCGGMLSSRRIGKNTLVMMLAQGKTFVALTSDSGATSNWTQYELTGDDFRYMGPGIDSIIVHAEGKNFAQGFKYQVVLQKRFAEGAWEDDANSVVLATQSTEGYKQNDPGFADRDSFGIQSRLVLRTAFDDATGASGARGDLSLAVAIRFWD